MHQTQINMWNGRLVSFTLKDKYLIRDIFVSMEQHVFYYFVEYRGRHRKGFAIYAATEVNLQQKLWFHSTKMYF